MLNPTMTVINYATRGAKSTPGEQKLTAAIFVGVVMVQTWQVRPALHSRLSVRSCPCRSNLTSAAQDDFIHRNYHLLADQRHQKELRLLLLLSVIIDQFLFRPTTNVQCLKNFPSKTFYRTDSLPVSSPSSIQEINWSWPRISSAHANHRAATNILTKIRNFRDLRTCQKGPKSDQKGT